MKDREKIIANLERTFAYLGCANIDTSPMDGAVPLDAIATSSEKSGGETVGLLDTNPLVTGLPTSWTIKVTHLDGDDLVLMTCSDLHWSNVDKTWQSAIEFSRKFGEKVSHPDFDCYSMLHYSCIDKFGRFRKYPVDRPIELGTTGARVTRIFNPVSVVGYKQDVCVPLRCQWEGIDKELGIDNGYGLVRVANMLAGMCNGMRFHWYAKVSIDQNIPSVSLITDPTGIKELWKLRDVPAGKKRRDALLHWVSDHWRANRVDPELESYVRKHLRGSTSFTQGDFKVDIHISETDKVEVEKSKEDRKKMQDAKTDLRKRKALLREKTRC